MAKKTQQVASPEAPGASQEKKPAASQEQKTIASKLAARNAQLATPSPLTKCRTVLAMAGRATAAAARMSEAEQANYAALLGDDGLPTVPNLIDAVKQLETGEEKSDDGSQISDI